MACGLVPFVDDGGGGKFVDQVSSVAAGDGKGDLTAQNGAGDDDYKTRTAIHVSSCDHQSMTWNNGDKDLRHEQTEQHNRTKRAKTLQIT